MAINLEKTLRQYDAEVKNCQTIFEKKMVDYGTSWRVLRPISIADQIMIKALRIRNIQEVGEQKIEDRIDSEFKGMMNYGIIALIQLDLTEEDAWELDKGEALRMYKEKSGEVRDLMLKKNHDYGEAWRQMTQESYVDLILSKLQRIRRIIAQSGKTIVSEGIDANFADIVNYSLFALIRITEEKKGQDA